MKKEGIEFLKNLQHEMLTQDKVGQADPRFWVVMQKTKEYNVEDDYDGIYIHDTGAAENVFEGNIDKELVDWIISDLENVQSCEYDGIDITVTYEDMEYIISSDDDLQSFLNEYEEDRYNVGTYRIKDEIAENTMFLTLKECKKHIELNGYHYHSPYPYAMTAWRSPQVEQLYKILQETNWDEILNTKESRKLGDDFCQKKYECKGNCLMNTSGDFQVWDKLSCYCKGTLEDQQFMNDLFSGQKSKEDVFDKYNLSESEKKIIENYTGK